MPGMADERRAQREPPALAAVEADREAVRLVAQRLQHEHLGAARADRDRVLRVRQEDAIGSLRRVPLARRLAGGAASAGGAALGGAAPRSAAAVAARFAGGSAASPVLRRDGSSAVAAGARPRAPSRARRSAARRPGRTSMPTSRAAASAIASWPLPPSTTIRSGSFQRVAVACRLARAPEPPRQHLVHRREVVVRALRAPAARRRAHLVGAVARLLRPPVDEHHHRRHRREPLQVRDVVALDRARQLRQLEPLLQLAQRQLGVGARVAARGEAGGGVLARQLDQLAAIAALGHQHLDPLLAPALRRAARCSVSHSAFSAASSMSNGSSTSSGTDAPMS